MNEVKMKGADEIFCSSCGEIIKKEAEHSVAAEDVEMLRRHR